MKYRREVEIGGLLIVSLLVSLSFLSVDNIQQLLDENPTAQLILAEGFEKNRLELIGRTIDPEVEYLKWRFEDIYLKTYAERDLVSTSEWRIFDGLTQIKYRKVANVTYNYSATEAWITESAEYYADSSYKTYIGKLTRTIQIWPSTMKESVVLDAENKDLRLQYLLFLDNHDDGERIDLDFAGNSILEYPDLELNWTADREKVSSAYKYGNGRVQINFNRGEYEIDPLLTIGAYQVQYDWAPLTYQGKDIGREYYSSLTSGDLPIIIRISDDLSISKNKISKLLITLAGVDTQDFLDFRIELAKNETFEVTKWVPNIICSDIDSQTGLKTDCVDNGYWNNYTDWMITWVDFDALPETLNLQGMKWYMLNYRGVWKAKTGTQAVDIVPTLNDYPFVELAWWNTSYNYKQNVNVTISENKTNYPVQVNFDYSSNGTNFNWAEACQGKIAFTDDAETTELDWYNISCNTAGALNVSVEGTWDYFNGTQAYVYYSCSSCTDNSDVNETFFSESTIDLGIDNLGFEADSVGANPAGWTIVEAGADGDVLVSSDEAQERSHSVWFYDNTSGSGYYPSMYQSLSSPTAVNTVLEFYVNVINMTASDKAYLPILESNNSNSQVTYIAFSDNGSIQADDGNTVKWTNKTYTEGVWHNIKLEIFFDADKYNLWVDGEFAGYRSFRENAGEVDFLDEIFFNGGSTNLGAWYLDAIRLYDYMATPPSTALGTESPHEILTTTLLSPANLSRIEDSTPDFSFNANGSYLLWDCELFINSTPYGTNSTVLNGTYTTITTNTTLSYNYYQGYVSCENGTASDSSDTHEFWARKLMAGHVEFDNGTAAVGANVTIISQADMTIYGQNYTDADGNWTYEIYETANYTVVAFMNETIADGDADPHIEVT